jgi:chromosome segregation ATPase
MEAELSGLRSRLREVLGNLEGKHERLQATVTRQGDELAETCRRNEELGGRVQQLEEENRRLHDSSQGLHGQLAPVAAGESQVKEDLSNIQGDFAKLKEDITVTKRTMRKQFFALLVKKGNLHNDDSKRPTRCTTYPTGSLRT